MKAIDTHAHLVTEIKYKDSNLEDVIQDGLANLAYVFNIGIDVKTSKEVIELNKKYPRLLPVIGIHPSDANEFKPSDVLEIEELINENVIAIGETGLDYYHEHNIPKQKESFIAHIELAKKHNLPIVIHSRDSHDDVYEIVSKYPDVKFLLHS
jgi:TatD DNase family protein